MRTDGDVCSKQSLSRRRLVATLGAILGLAAGALAFDGTSRVMTPTAGDAAVAPVTGRA